MDNSLLAVRDINHKYIVVGGIFISNLLQHYFPIIRTRQEVLDDICSRTKLYYLYQSWDPASQQEFLDICSGAKGVKMLYDSFFKEIMNPEYAPERLSESLSLILGQTIHILDVLPNDSTRLSADRSLILTDIVVELEDHSIANVEIQKQGYLFPGQRSACYSADLLLRQYQRVRSIRGKHFTYKDVKNVYTIVLFEQSPAVFHRPEYQDIYLHHAFSVTDTGIPIELLQKYCFIPLDIFMKHFHNKGIQNDLDAWLAFLSIDDPELIVTLLSRYPKFQDMYADVYELCRNMEDIMGLFSKELQILDENTVDYMIDEMQATIDELKRNNQELQTSNQDLQSQLAHKELELQQLRQQAR